ncbi:hypothetical protein TELCIR_15043 [Teladorsagia circumcincta]|uniref:Uncharacterized protein n=1 Tax=Teladorsagia circumcincta TaxID=45464 RepID=A0A2G9TZL4_TELCI|nr:hypothetical protein TELCIR_15043 [Teladorsagia circumcincta]
MVRIATEGEYVPWYSRRACPVFCYPCVPAYMGVWKARKCVLVTGAVLFFIGVIILLAMLLTCIAVECSNVKTVTTTTTTYHDPESDLTEQRLFESAYREPVPETHAQALPGKTAILKIVRRQPVHLPPRALMNTSRRAIPTLILA